MIERIVLMKNDYTSIVVVSIVSISLVILLFGAFIAAFVGGGFALLMTKPAPPLVEHGEFDFELVYEINGEILSVHDTAICEFDGYGEKSTAGQYRKWAIYSKGECNSTFADGNYLGITLVDVSDMGYYDSLGRKMLELYFYGGNAHYYMSDTFGNLHRPPQNLGKICYVYSGSKGIGHSSIEGDIAIEKYGIKLVKWKCEEPLENSFE